MGIQWVVVATAVLSCTLYTLEAKPFRASSSASVVDLDSLTLSERQEINRVWDEEIRKIPVSAGESTHFYRAPGQGRYIYGYTFNNGEQSHMQTSDGKDRTLGKYTYKDAFGKDVEVHYASGPSGYRVLANNLPTDTDEVKLAKDAFFKAFQERKALHAEQRMSAGRITPGGVAIAAAATLTSSRGRPMAAALKYGEQVSEEEEEGEESDEESEDSDEGSDSSSEEGGVSSSEEGESSSSEEDGSSSSEEGDDEDSDEEEEDDEEEDEEEGDDEEEEDDEEDDEEGDEEDEEDEEESEEDGEDSSSSSSSEEDEDEDILRAQFDENYGNRLYQTEVVYRK
ncbi:uncharacterized protein LOC143018791 [Oratosquilla oratoria]|uniref:uncharacterized protein LOC143018791 n=1 Tax=Oratosquilla oratoria TaxID=337810 RepID=UPI003F759D53